MSLKIMARGPTQTHADFFAREYLRGLVWVCGPFFKWNGRLAKTKRASNPAVRSRKALPVRGLARLPC
jgi:hypothetical protein